MAIFSKSGVWDKVTEGSTIIFGDPCNTVWDRWKEASMPQNNSIRPVVSVQYRLVTEGQTDRQTDNDSIYRRSVACSVAR